MLLCSSILKSTVATFRFSGGCLFLVLVLCHSQPAEQYRIIIRQHSISIDATATTILFYIYIYELTIMPADSSYYGRSDGGGGASASPSSKPAAASGGLDQGKIFVGGLSWQTTEESLRWHFEQYGPVVSVEVMKDRVTGDPRGFAFVVFEEGATVDLVMAEAKHEINHKIVDVKRAQARGIAPPSIHGKREAEAAAAAAAAAGGSGGGDAAAGSGGGGGGGGGEERPQSESRHSSQPNNKMTPEQLHNKVFVGGTNERTNEQTSLCCAVLSCLVYLV
jgi:uncharacterized membrane protein YgcG